MARLPREKKQIGRYHAGALHQADNPVGIEAAQVIDDWLAVVDNRGPTPAAELSEPNPCRRAAGL